MLQPTHLVDFWRTVKPFLADVQKPPSLIVADWLFAAWLHGCRTLGRIAASCSWRSICWGPCPTGAVYVTAAIAYDRVRTFRRQGPDYTAPMEAYFRQLGNKVADGDARIRASIGGDTMA